jgi:hypothetical protein
LDISRYSSLGRTIDLRYGPHRAITLLAAAAAVILGVQQMYRGASTLEAASQAAGAGILVFLTWALARELDPDHELSAFAAALLSGAGMLWLGLPTLLPSLWVILALRVVNRTVGRPPTGLDWLGMLGLTLYMSLTASWLFAAFTAAAAGLDASLAEPNRPSRLIAALSAGLAVGAYVLEPGRWVGLERSPLELSVLLAGSLFAGLIIVTSARVASVADLTGNPLIPARVQSAQALGWSIGTIFMLRQGQTGLITQLPLWAGLIGVGLYRALVILPGQRQAGAGSQG